MLLHNYICKTLLPVKTNKNKDLNQKILIVVDLKASLEAKVYGQHLVVRQVVNSINGHLKHDSPKALVLSFQGGTGTGKNLVAHRIAEAIYSAGIASRYVHILSATNHFPRTERLASYKVGYSASGNYYCNY